MKKSDLTQLKAMADHVLGKEEQKYIVGGLGSGSCMVSCSNGFMGSVNPAYGCNSPGPYWVCFHSGGPSNSVTDCSCS